MRLPLTELRQNTIPSMTGSMLPRFLYTCEKCGEDEEQARKAAYSKASKSDETTSFGSDLPAQDTPASTRASTPDESEPEIAIESLRISDAKAKSKSKTDKPSLSARSKFQAIMSSGQSRPTPTSAYPPFLEAWILRPHLATSTSSSVTCLTDIVPLDLDEISDASPHGQAWARLLPDRCIGGTTSRPCQSHPKGGCEQARKTRLSQGECAHYNDHSTGHVPN